MLAYCLSQPNITQKVLERIKMGKQRTICAMLTFLEEDWDFLKKNVMETGQPFFSLQVQRVPLCTFPPSGVLE